MGDRTPARSPGEMYGAAVTAGDSEDCVCHKAAAEAPDPTPHLPHHSPRGGGGRSEGCCGRGRGSNLGVHRRRAGGVQRLGLARLT